MINVPSNAQIESGGGDAVRSLPYTRTYEDPKTFAPYQMILLAADFIFNWIVDWAHTDPLAVLVIFVFQTLGLLVNLVVYIMASASQALQSGLRKNIIYHHQVNLLTCLTYFALTCSWYVWALRKSWPSVSDQFSFSFSSDDAPSGNPDQSTSSGDSLSTPSTLMTTTFIPSPFNSTANNATLPTILNTLVTQTIKRNPVVRRLLYTPPEYDTIDPSSMMEANNDPDKLAREFYTLWSPGFVALYVVHRTVAVLYYWVSIKATYLVLNASTIDNLDKIKYGTGKNESSKEQDSLGNSFEDKDNVNAEAGEVGMAGRDSNDTEINEQGRLKNLRNNCEILWSKKGFSPADVEEESANPPNKKGGKRNANNGNSSIFTVQS